MKTLTKLGLSGLAAGLLAVPAMADVEVVFSDFLNAKMDRITAIEEEREAVFRDYRTEGTRTGLPPSARLNRSRFPGTEWANERLFPDVKGYNVPALFKAMMERGIREADPGFDGAVTLEIEKLRIENFSLAVISSRNTQVSGKVIVHDAHGNLVAEHKIWSSLVPEYSASQTYNGPNYAYRTAAMSSRIGPAAAEFTEKALEKLYPGYDAPGLVIVDR